MRIQVTQSSMPKFEEYIDEIRELWDSKWLTNNGEKHNFLEEKLKNYLKVENISLFTNGHLALETIISTLGLTGEVITTPFTFASTTHAIVRSGLKPVFCDINSNDYTIDVTKIESLITDKTSAIIPVHVFGNICDVIAIEKIAKKHDLKVIYDAAHTFGVTIDGEGIGTYGDASMFSFHATKVFNTIEGGAITYNDKTITQTLKELKNFGITGPESVGYVGGNAKMNEFQAAMGICNLRNIDSEIAKRKVISNLYNNRLKNINGIKINDTKNNIKENYSYYPVVFDGYYKTRDEVYEELKSHGIMSRKYFYPLTSSFECYEDQYNTDDTPTALYISKRVLTLPLYADLSSNDVDRICDIILNIGGNT